MEQRPLSQCLERVHAPPAGTLSAHTPQNSETSRRQKLEAHWESTWQPPPCGSAPGRMAHSAGDVVSLHVCAATARVQRSISSGVRLDPASDDRNRHISLDRARHPSYDPYSQPR
jgi:hypothetical protein